MEKLKTQVVDFLMIINMITRPEIRLVQHLQANERANKIESEPNEKECARITH